MASPLASLPASGSATNFCFHLEEHEGEDGQVGQVRAVGGVGGDLEGDAARPAGAEVDADLGADGDRSHQWTGAVSERGGDIIRKAWEVTAEGRGAMGWCCWRELWAVMAGAAVLFLLQNNEQ